MAMGKKKITKRCEICGMPYDDAECPYCGFPEVYYDIDVLCNCYTDADPGL